MWISLRKWFDQQYSVVSANVKAWFAVRAEECRHCHACGGEVAALEKVCPHCGSGEPARLAIAPVAVAIFSAGLVLLLLAILV